MEFIGKSQGQNLRELFSQEQVDRMYFKDRGGLFELRSLKLVAKLKPLEGKRNVLSSVVRFANLLEVLGGGLPRVSLVKTNRRLWIELRATVRGGRCFILCCLLFNRLFINSKDRQKIVSFHNRGGSAVFSVHNGSFFDFFGQQSIVDEKILGHFEVVFYGGSAPMGFWLRNCIGGF